MRSYPIDFTAVRLFPARLVRITRLDGEILRIAEADESITIPSPSEVFTPLPGAQISAVKHIINGEMPSMEIKFAHSVGGVLDTAKLNNGFWDGATVQEYPVDRANLTALGDAQFTGVIDTVNLDPIGSGGSFDIRGLAAKAESFIQTYSPMDRTDLFSVLNQLEPTDWDHAGTIVTQVDHFNFTVSISSPPADGYFNGGVFETASGFKAVIANWVQSTQTVTTYQKVCLTRLSVSEAITLYAGYDRTADQARNKFNNKINFQGEDHFLGIKSIVGL